MSSTRTPDIFHTSPMLGLRDDPELSVLDTPPLISGGQIISANVQVVSPTLCIYIGSLLILLFVRETKGKSLEELGQVFAILGTHAACSLRQIPYGFKFVLIQDPIPEQLYQSESENEGPV
ncbi:uncharacterized protein BJ212DRAFT_1485245 [Suillus subaureus]|uniref:Uncharacterized protein n=1 Tax=Suillus subaureus TaxID=48587 RepID=A0A9P7E170_9AGAM|nr:uncharacterized protein BJ212DRAFT_1485245 [Suillus subaureus]KAG1807963.1 hypothetical protein BJ212DRAFT_1485245 [Suillus subaureus]